MKPLKLWTVFILALGAYDEAGAVALHIHVGPFNEYTIPLLFAGMLLEAYALKCVIGFIRRRIRRMRGG